MHYTSGEDGRMDRQTEITKDDLTIVVEDQEMARKGNYSH
jgi:hypothetical protein